MSILKKSYDKWRHEQKGVIKDKMNIHLQVLETYHGAYHAHKEYQYILKKMFPVVTNNTKWKLV